MSGLTVALSIKKKISLGLVFFFAMLERIIKMFSNLFLQRMNLVLYMYRKKRKQYLKIPTALKA